MTAIEELKDRIEHLETRLEIKSVCGKTVEYDGIYCRDETIRQLNMRVERMEDALREIKKYSLDATFVENKAQQALEPMKETG